MARAALKFVIANLAFEPTHGRKRDWLRTIIAVNMLVGVAVVVLYVMRDRPIF